MSSHGTTHRWAFLLEFPKHLRGKADALAQRTLDLHRGRAFRSSISYPIVDPHGNSYGTLPAFRSSDYWDYLNASFIYERGGRCEICETRLDLHTYHLSFENIGSEGGHRHELFVACVGCHDYLRQQEWTGRRYNWRVQPLEAWLYVSKQRRQRMASRTMLAELRTETVPPAGPTPIEAAIATATAKHSTSSTATEKRFPLRNEPSTTLRIPSEISLEIDGRVFTLRECSGGDSR